MKLILQIFLGVFLGSLASGLLLDVWHSHQAQIAKQQAENELFEQERLRVEQNDHIRELFLQSQQNSASGMSNNPVSPAVVPDDIPPDLLKQLSR